MGGHAQKRCPHEPHHLQHDRGRNRQREGAIKASAGCRRKSGEEGKRQEIDEQRELEPERLGPDIDPVDEPLVHQGGEAGRDHKEQHRDAESRIERLGAEQIDEARPRWPEGSAERVGHGGHDGLLQGSGVVGQPAERGDRPQAQPGKKAGRAEQEGEGKADKRHPERQRTGAGVAHDPGADEEIEGEEMQPAGQEQFRRLEKPGDIPQTAEAAFGVRPEGQDQAGIGDRQQTGNDQGRNSLRPDGNPGAREQRGPADQNDDLRRALIEAAEHELTEKGFEGFTLRGCAKRAGVSHAAPAHHFKDAATLLSALAAEGFTRFLDTIAARQEATASSSARVWASLKPPVKNGDRNSAPKSCMLTGALLNSSRRSAASIKGYSVSGNPSETGSWVKSKRG